MGRKKPKARQKRITSIDIDVKDKNDKSKSAFKFASQPSSSLEKWNFQIDDWFPIFITPPVTPTLVTNKKGFPKLPIISNSMQELGTTDTESFQTLNQKQASCDNLSLTSTLTPISSSWELRVLETDALRMDKCCSFRLDRIIFKESVPCLGEHLQEDMTKLLNSLHPKTALSFRSKINNLSYTIDHSISTYDSACRMAAVRIDMLTTKESMLTEKVSWQRSQIEELENKVEKLTYLVRLTEASTSDKLEKKRTEIHQKDEIIKLLEEEVKILKTNKFTEQSSKLDEKDKVVVLAEEAENLKANRSSKFCSELNKNNKIVEYHEEAVSSKAQKLDTENISDAKQNLDVENFSTSCEKLIVEQKSKAETEINEFDEILELGKYLSKNRLSIQKAKEIISLQNETKSLKLATGDQEINLENVFVELKSLKSENASLTEQLHSKTQILESMDIEFSSLKNEILDKSTKIQKLEKTIKDINDDLEMSNGFILSLQEEKKALKQNLTLLEKEISNSKTSCLLEIPPLIRDREYSMEEEKINVHENDETQQVLQETKNLLHSSHFPVTEENGKESFEIDSIFMKNIPLNNVLTQYPDKPKRNITATNPSQEAIQNLKDVIEIQQLILEQQNTSVRKIIEEISSIKLQNSLLSERLSRNESKLSLLEVGMTSSESSILKHDASLQEFNKMVKPPVRNINTLNRDVLCSKKVNKALKENIAKEKNVSEKETPDGSDQIFQIPSSDVNVLSEIQKQEEDYSDLEEGIRWIVGPIP